MGALLSPTFWCGTALLVLGAGNWIIGQDKVQAHRRLLRSAELQAVVMPPEGFDQLSARTNATLLRPFRISGGRVSALEQKLEFYRVVESGGRVFCLLGMLFIVAATVRTSRQARAPGQSP